MSCCAISKQNVRCFAKILQAIGKIGEDVWINADPELLMVSAINKSRSMYAGFKLSKKFFEHFDISPHLFAVCSHLFCFLFSLFSLLSLFLSFSFSSSSFSLIFLLISV